MIKFNCPKCRKEFKSKDEYAGRKFTCTECNNECLIPTPKTARQPSAIAAAEPVPVNAPPTPAPLQTSKASAKPTEEAFDSCSFAGASRTPKVRRKHADSDVVLTPPLPVLEVDTDVKPVTKRVASKRDVIAIVTSTLVFLVLAISLRGTQSDPAEDSRKGVSYKSLEWTPEQLAEQAKPRQNDWKKGLTNDEIVKEAEKRGDWKTWESTPTEADKAYSRELERKLRRGR